MGMSRTPARVFLLIAVMIAAGLAAGFAPAVTGADRAEALSGSEFDPANIISDENFFNSGSMSEAQVQAFLESKEQGCTAANGYPCLKDYRMTTYTRSAVEPGHCGAYIGEVNERASRIIWKVAQACRINPQVLLVTLQKERSLITDLAPDSGDYRISMGYGCPDTSACDSEYFGFYNQVYKAAWQFRQYTQYPAGRRYVVGPSYVQYNPNTACGGTTVNIRNQATANLYLYTPYQPNAAALANLYGIGDGCSAYGNRNFWVFYNNWFGSPTTTTSGNPFGNVELVAVEPGAFRVIGWAIDPNTTSPIAVHVYVGSVGTATTADRPRSDVGAAYPGSGDAHGFDVTVAATGSGDVPVCVYAINSGAGANVLLSCTTVTALSGPPVGELTRISAGSASIDVAGWAIDPDTVSPIAVHVYVDSVGVAVNASTAVDGINSAYAQYGKNHGFATPIAAAAGTHQVCAYGINVGPGGNSVIGCQTVVVPGGAITEQGRPPVGALEQVTASTIGITATGWAIDPDTASAIPVHVYVDNVGKAFTANVTRNDLPAIWADYGTGHGFTAPIPAAPGTHAVCAYAINTVGPPTLLGCSSVIVPSLDMPDLGRVPFGNVEAVTPGPGTLAVSGWAIDPDTASPIPVHIYVDSAGTAVTADDPRADVAAVYPAYGSEHGFAWSGAVAAGAHRVCVYAINNGAGGPALLGCSNVTVPAPPTPEPSAAPIGNLESAVRDGYNVTVSGWALDPDTVNPIDVHVYVGATGEAIRADDARADVAAVYGLGTNHGFSAVLPIAAGPQSVCAYAIDSGGGPPSLIGCIQVP
jgi:hypothetical protein